MKDIFSKIERKGPLGKWAEQADGYYSFPKLEGKLASRMKFNGQEVINWSINDYLGLGNHPEIKNFDKHSVTEWGCAYPMGSRMLSGHTKYHEELEKKLAQFVNKESAYLGNFGYQMIMSCIDTLTNKSDVIIYDSHCHACIIDGIRLHLGKRLKFPHNNIDTLRKHLERATEIIGETGGGILVISEGIFGMQGEQGKLAEIVALKKEFDFRFLVDDAHGFGVMGIKGNGSGIHHGVQDEIDLYISTFSKSMASFGAFVAAKKQVIDYLRYNMRSQIFGKSLPLIYVIGALKRLETIKNEPNRRFKLWNNAESLQQGLRKLGYNIGKTNSCVTPIYLNGTIPNAMDFVKKLREEYRIFCSVIVYPVVPKGTILLRLIPTANHTLDDISTTLKAFEKLKTELL